LPLFIVTRNDLFCLASISPLYAQIDGAQAKERTTASHMALGEPSPGSVLYAYRGTAAVQASPNDSNHPRARNRTGCHRQHMCPSPPPPGRKENHSGARYAGPPTCPSDHALVRPRGDVSPQPIPINAKSLLLGPSSRLRRLAPVLLFRPLLAS
jgi:hypothetical protein